MHKEYVVNNFIKTAKRGEKKYNFRKLEDFRQN